MSFRKSKGVTFVKHMKNKPWKAQVVVDGHNYHIGYFESQAEAEAAYDNCAFFLTNRKLVATDLELNNPDLYSGNNFPDANERTSEICLTAVSRDTLQRHKEPTRAEVIAHLKKQVLEGRAAEELLKRYNVTV